MDQPGEEPLTGERPSKTEESTKGKTGENVLGAKMTSKSPKRPPQRIYPDLSDLKEEDYSAQEDTAATTEAQSQDKPPDYLEIEEEAKDYWNFYFVGVFISLIFSISLYYLHYQKANGNKTTSLLPSYLKEIENLSADYGHQTEQFWDTVKSFPYYLLSEEEHEGPAVLLMVAPTGSVPLALKLAEQLSKIVNNLFESNANGFHAVEGSLLSDEPPDVQKLKIDQSIRDAVDTQRRRAVVVTNLERIDPVAVMIFHGYCDNTEAVYKNIAIVFLLEMPKEASAKRNREVYDYLSKLWSPLGQTRIQALFTRMANNIAILEAQ